MASRRWIHLGWEGLSEGITGIFVFDIGCALDEAIVLATEM